MSKDLKDIYKLKLNVPSHDVYESFKTSKIKTSKIKCLYKLASYKFFVVDKDNNIISKIKHKSFSLKDQYIIYNPFGVRSGDITYRSGRKNPGYDVYLYKGHSFSIEGKKSKGVVSYDIKGLPVIIKTEEIGVNFDILDKETKKKIAKVTYYSHGSKGMDFEIKFTKEDYRYEIYLAIICTKFIQIALMDK